MHSDDYKKGWFDGYQAGKAVSWPLSPADVTGQPLKSTKNLACKTCDMSFEKIMMYSCPRSDCPSRVTF